MMDLLEMERAAAQEKAIMNFEEWKRQKVEANAKFEALPPQEQEDHILKRIAKNPLADIFMPWPAWDEAVKRLAAKGLIEIHWHISIAGRRALDGSEPGPREQGVG